MKNIVAFIVFILSVSAIAVEIPRPLKVAGKRVIAESGRERRRNRRKALKLA